VKILIATNNAHKFEEISEMLGEEFELVSLREFPEIEMPEETGSTMAQNAKLKAQHGAESSGLICLADDSGIEVDALGGAPGVLSARWVSGSDKDRTHALLQKMESVAEGNRTARYRCAICVAFPDGKILETEGVCEGKIARVPRGENGFGYDPIFTITDATGAGREYSGQTMAQVSPRIKSQISHRARALQAMREILR
jgi:XTP/dITP diphosphohydrolase